MLCRRTIELPPHTPRLPSPLINRELLADAAQAAQLIERARAQADALLVEAQARQAALLESAWLDFWKQANAQLLRWENQRQAMCDQLEQIATTVTHQAIRNLLDELPPPHRVSALLKHLLATHIPATQATLLCNPHDRETVEQWLGIHNDVPWSLRPEDSLPPHTLMLETDEGGIRVDWTSALDSLLMAEAEHPRR